MIIVKSEWDDSCMDISYKFLYYCFFYNSSVQTHTQFRKGTDGWIRGWTEGWMDVWESLGVLA